MFFTHILLFNIQTTLLSLQGVLLNILLGMHTPQMGYGQKKYYCPMNNNELLSKTISFLRLPLIIGVVLIHSRVGTSYIAEGSFPIYNTVSHIISNILARVAVPCFFIFSGYFFFRNGGAFTPVSYRDKLLKRSRTILLPYILWNLAVMALFLLSEPFTKGLVLDSRKLVSDYSLVEVVQAFWNLNDGFPICYQLWFIRDLMVIMLLSPLIYWALQTMKHYFLIIVGALWLTGWSLHIDALSTTALLYFSAGAYFGITKQDFVAIAKRIVWPALIIYIFMALADVIFLEEPWHWYINRAAIPAGIITTIGLSARFVESNRWQALPHLAGIGFFMYAFHGMPLTLTTKLAFRYFNPQGDMAILGLYFLCPLVVLCIGFTLYYLIARYLPRLMSLITGGR